MRAADLLGKKVQTEEGRTLGRVHDIELRDGVVHHLVCGERGLLEQLGFRKAKGRHIAWSDVLSLSQQGAITVRATAAEASG